MHNIFFIFIFTNNQKTIKLIKNFKNYKIQYIFIKYNKIYKLINNNMI